MSRIRDIVLFLGLLLLLTACAAPGSYSHSSTGQGADRNIQMYGH